MFFFFVQPIVCILSNKLSRKKNPFIKSNFFVYKPLGSDCETYVN